MKVQNINSVTFCARNKMKQKIRAALTKDDDFTLKQYYEDIKDIKALSRNEERKLAQQINEGGEAAKKAWETLVLSALPMVVYVARYLDGRGMEFADIIQEGNIALINMPYLKNYDGKLNSRHGIYHYIPPKILRAIENKADLIRIPSNAGINSRKVKKAEKELELSLKRRPTEKEIADFLQLSEKEVCTARMADMTFIPYTESVADRLDRENYKMSEKQYFEGQRNLDREQLAEDLKIHLEKLPPAKKDIIIKRFGLFGTKVYSVSEIAKEKNLSSARINMIIQEGLIKLRQNNGIKKMPDLTAYMV